MPHEPSSPPATRSAASGEMLLDTENVFHSRRHQPGPVRVARVVHTLAVIAEWFAERTSDRVRTIRSYGKNNDTGVAALLGAIDVHGADVVRVDGERLDDEDRQLVDVTARLRLPSAEGRIRVVHTDVRAGKDVAEDRLLAELEARRDGDAFAGWRVLCSGDRRVLGYVDRLTAPERERCLIVVPHSGVTMLSKVGRGGPGGFARLAVAQVVLLPALVQAAQAASLEPGGRSARSRRVPSAAAPVPEVPELPELPEVPELPELHPRDGDWLQALEEVRWPALVGARPGEDGWAEALALRSIDEAVRRSLADPDFRRRFARSASGVATVAKVEAGESTERGLRHVVCSAVLYEAMRRDHGIRARLRREIERPEHRHLRPCLEAVHPLLGAVEAVPVR